MHSYLRVIGENSKPIEIDEKHIIEIDYQVLTPNDSNARSTDVVYKLIITGRIIPEARGADGEKVVALDKWSKVQHGNTVYRYAEAGYSAEGYVLRKYTFNKAFAHDYKEYFDDKSGTGTFILELVQKKDHNKFVTVEGGYKDSEVS